MTRLLSSAALSVSALALIGCGGGASEADDLTPAEIEAPMAGADVTERDGRVVIAPAEVISEPNACLLMFEVRNGLDRPVSAGIFAFSVTGNGKKAGGNMFPQMAAPGEIARGQVIFPGAQCDDLKVVEGGQPNCAIVGVEGDSCKDQLVFEAGQGVTFQGQ